MFGRKRFPFPCSCPILFLCVLQISVALFVIFRASVPVDRDGDGHDPSNAKLLLQLFGHVTHLDVSKYSQVQQEDNKAQPNCDLYSCLDLYQCGSSDNRLSVHFSPPTVYQDAKSGARLLHWSQEHVKMLETVRKSRYFTPDSSQACLFLPHIEIYNHENRNSRSLISNLLSSMDTWNGGQNNLVFRFHHKTLDYPTGKAILAGSQMTISNYRRGFDISIPAYSSLLSLESKGGGQGWNGEKKILLLLPLASDQKTQLLYQNLSDRDPSKVHNMNVGTSVEHFRSKLKQSEFCLIDEENFTLLLEIIHYGCVPVISADSLVLPFSEVLDWTNFSIRIYEQDLENGLVGVLESLSMESRNEMSAQLEWIYDRHFASLSHIVITVLDILNDRLFPAKARSQLDWNQRPAPMERKSNPIFLNHLPDKNDGCTAVILTYDRLESLFNVMKAIARAPSVSNILVIWNNQHVSPPDAEMWPKLEKSFVVKRTSGNLLSNRYFPFKEINTECVLSMDDDITMLTSDELEFGYQVWRENPDRIVGFPSRTHLWLNSSKSWKYESEWTSDISMVLTGASFYNKYWHYLYTKEQNIKKWVNDNMNCEDIAFNFLVSHWTGKVPIKIGPRKKFRCSTPQCINNDALSGIQSHMVERSQCVNELTKIYGYMPLRVSEFRADPVLYLDQLPENINSFSEIGSL